MHLYFGSIGYELHPHTLVVALSVFGEQDPLRAMVDLQAEVQPVLDSIVVPYIIIDN